MPFVGNNVASHLSSKNSSTNLLGSEETFTGEIEEVKEYTSIILNIYSNVTSYNSGISIQFSQDRVNWDLKITDTYLNSSTAYNKNFPILARFFRILYKNGSSTQTTFRLQTIFHYKITNNEFNPATIAFGNKHTDAFARLRVSNPETLFEMSNNQHNNNTIMSQKTTGSSSITHITNDSTVDLSVTANNDTAIRQSRRYIPYQPGKSLLVMITGVLNSNSNGSDVTSNIGYYDDDNGVFYKYNNNILSLNLRSSGTGSVVTTNIPSSQWNIDPMDGTGTSGIIIDATKAQIFIFDVEWLGVGTVRCGVVIDGNIFYTHFFHHANNVSTTYMRSATLPIRYEISVAASGSNTSGKLKEICATVMSEGGFEPIGKQFSISNGTTAIDIDENDEKPLIVLRLKSANNRATAHIINLHLISLTKSNILYRLRIYHGVSTLTNLFTTNISFTSVNTDSFIEYNLSALFNSSNPNIVSNTIVTEGYFTEEAKYGSENILNNIDISSDIDGTSDILILTATGIGASNNNVLGNIIWTEFS